MNKVLDLFASLLRMLFPQPAGAHHAPAPRAAAPQAANAQRAQDTNGVAVRDFERRHMAPRIRPYAPAFADFEPIDMSAPDAPSLVRPYVRHVFAEVAV